MRGQQSRGRSRASAGSAGELGPVPRAASGKRPAVPDLGRGAGASGRWAGGAGWTMAYAGGASGSSAARGGSSEARRTLPRRSVMCVAH